MIFDLDPDPIIESEISMWDFGEKLVRADDPGLHTGNGEKMFCLSCGTGAGRRGVSVAL